MLIISYRNSFYRLRIRTRSRNCTGQNLIERSSILSANDLDTLCVFERLNLEDLNRVVWPVCWENGGNGNGGDSVNGNGDDAKGQANDEDERKEQEERERRARTTASHHGFNRSYHRYPERAGCRRHISSHVVVWSCLVIVF
ncbi:unnamed protein product [Arctia plantaginis]|uniref:Uncharacterized protein n=1 Tax=Arctia plantaginis TaxID=874455 RepID=A0A8S0ZXI6_ARCPL|nr:unnamed protein product [Arctia plantaginis]CAB3238667.1 unnamed protein product [Arctia plantaginis]